MKRILFASALVFALARPALVGADPGVFAVAEIGMLQVFNLLLSWLRTKVSLQRRQA